jgi:hypothetical protein
MITTQKTQDELRFSSENFLVAYYILLQRSRSAQAVL